MSTYVLVHGAWHGGWCWARLVPELVDLGHRAVVMDLPVDDGDATFLDYAAAVKDAWPDEGDTVLVGHSLGAMVLPLVAASRPVTQMIFVCGLIPNVDGQPWEDAPPMGRPEAYRTETRADGSEVFATMESAQVSFYQDCEPPDVGWAYARLRPQNSRSLWDRPYPLDQLPDVPRAAIAAVDDAAITIEFSRSITRPRIGVDPVEIPGAHSPFLSRPKEFANLLDRLTIRS